MPGAVQEQHQAPANHVAELTVGLDPVPGLAGADRERIPAQARIFRDQPPQESQLSGANFTTAKMEDNVRHPGKIQARGSNATLCRRYFPNFISTRKGRHNGAVCVAVGSPFHNSACN